MSELSEPGMLKDLVSVLGLSLKRLMMQSLLGGGLMVLSLAKCTVVYKPCMYDV